MSSMSKRQQARNERALQELIQTVPGNDRCADCGARNPGWASWSLGVFLCVRCASLHRKLGTHLSKVKSLSMDKWSTEQVEAMKRSGNATVNKSYNPRNIKPDIPFDVDMVDSAMEKFIRQKYQERSLSDGKPQPPSRNETSYTRSRSIDDSPPPPLPPKKGKLFGFGLRATSSAFPLSKHDKRNVPVEPTLDNAFRVNAHSLAFSKPSKVLGTNTGLHDPEHEGKLATLRDMGFPDDKRNSSVLRGLNGNLERTVESLVRLGEGSQTPKNGSRNHSPYGSAKPTPSSATFPEFVKSPTPQPPSASNNPFDRPSGNDPIGLSFGALTQQQTSKNPFDSLSTVKQPYQSLEQSLQGMQIRQPLFPNSTGGYPTQPPPLADMGSQQSLTPPLPPIPQQYAYPASPVAMNNSANPFFQTMIPPPNNPFTSMMQNTPAATTSSNPFLATNLFAPSPQAFHPHQSQPPSNHNNPFGIPPSEQQSTFMQQPISQFQSAFDGNQQAFNVNLDAQPYFNQIQPSHSSIQPERQDSPPSFSYPPQSQTQQFLQPQSQPQSQPSPQIQQQQSHYGSNQPFQNQHQYSPQPQPLLPQQTGRKDKSSILALYNYPHLAPPPMPTIPDANEFAESSAQSQRVPSDPCAGMSNVSAKRSVTMPTSFSGVPPSSSTVSGSRNPFLRAGGAGGGIGARHASQESANIANLECERHSPDAFASLSARYMR